MNPRLALLSLALVSTAFAADPAVKVKTGHSTDTNGFKPGDIPGPALNDAGANAFFKIISGKADENCAVLPILKDGKAAENEDDPEHAFFFAIGEKGGRITAELKEPTDVKEVVTYSWHSAGRAPQIYKLYATDGSAANFNAEPAAGTDPASVGWKLIANVDTHDKGAGQHAVSIATESGEPLGKFKRLLFDIAANDDPNGWGNTFFNEIDIVDAKGPALVRSAEKKVETLVSKDGKYKYVLDSTESPDLADWAKVHLMPVMEEWYPKIIEMLPVEGYTPPTTVYFTMRLATTLPGHAQGVPAYASGDHVTLNANFMRDQQGGEAVGCAIHEIVHVVQFGSGVSNRGQRPPTWVTEGAADYIRWFLYEPQAHGADITKRNWASAKYDASYRVTANFYDYVIKNHEKDLMKKLNLASHTGYSPDLWKQWTGKTAEELNDDWKADYKKRLGIE